jgi:hypothetical protein
MNRLVKAQDAAQLYGKKSKTENKPQEGMLSGIDTQGMSKA